MQNPQTIKEAFSQLLARLFEYEIDNFLQDPDFRRLEDFENDVIIECKSAQLFEDKIVNEQVHKMIMRLQNIQNSLNEKINRMIWKSEQTKEFCLIFCKSELEMYLHYLEILFINSSSSEDSKRKLTLSRETPKIKWLGSKNILGTLIYELWNGQEKGKGIYTNPIIKPESKEQLMMFIVNNFEDSEGHPFTLSSVSDYLSSAKSKQKSRAKEGVRIEFTIP